MTADVSANAQLGDWDLPDLMADYAGLLARTGTDPTQAVASHLQPPANQPSSAPVTSTLLAYPDRASQCLDQAMTRLSAPDRRTAATVLWQRLSLDVLAPACVLWMATQRLPLHQTDQIGWCLDTGNWARLDAPGLSTEPPGVALETLAHWLDTMERLFRGCWHISKSGFWSSAALAVARPYSLLFMQLPGDDWRPQAEHWLHLMPAPIARYLNWVEVERAGTTMTIPRRKGCCLKYRLPDGRLCGTCGIRRAQPGV